MLTTCKIDPEKRDGPVSKTNFFSSSDLKFGLKMGGGGGGVPSPGSTTAWQNINHSSENSKVIYIERSLFYAIINYQSKTGELKNREKSVKKTGQALKVLLE